MLGQLIEYADRNNFSREPGFRAKRIKWLVNVSDDGRFLGVLRVGEGKNGKRGRLFSQCPNLEQPDMLGLPNKLRAEQIGLDDSSQFLAESCGVVALLPKFDQNGEAKYDDKYDKASKKHPTFALLIRLASQAIPELQSLVTALSDPEQLSSLRDELKTLKADPKDSLSFVVKEEPLLDTDIWRDWWKGFYARYFGEDESTAIKVLNLANGKLCTPALTHPKLAGLGDVGAIGPGAPLIGFDKDAFTSFGLTKSVNAAISVGDAFAYRNALDALLEDGQTLGQMKVALWYDQDVAVEDDLSSDLFEPNAESSELSALERAKTLLSAIRTGQKPEELGRSQFYAIALSGAAGRAMVRNWQTGNLEQFVIAVQTWFEDLSIINARGRNIANLPGLNRLLMSVQRPKAKETKLEDYIKPVRMFQLPLWQAALDPKIPIPLAAIAKIMESFRAEVMTGAFDETIKSRNPDESRASLGRIYARMSLLKAYHNRKARNNPKGGHQMTPALNEEHTSKAYQCGRLMYLLANIQEAALGSDLNAGVVQRYYGAASSTPALVLGRLTRLSQSHLSKISGDKPGLAVYLERQIAQVWNALGTELPKTLSLEEQSLFALGYYQQFAARPDKGNNNSDDLSKPGDE
jgi:CRISPR-associated protein Csd1